MFSKKKIIIISISSDIGNSIALNYLKTNKIIGTFNQSNQNTRSIFKHKNVYLKNVNLNKKSSIESFCKYILKNHNNWSHIIFCNGDLNPIGEFTKVDFKKWEKSFNVNFISVLNILNLLLKKNKKSRKILFFAGDGTNDAVKYYSAYTLSKVILIKFTELLDFEEKKIYVGILGPGVIKTKLHNSTFKSKIINLNKKESIKNISKKDTQNDLNQLNLCIDWIFKNLRLISGRNISLKFDKWGNKGLLRKLKKNYNLFKLRRYGN